ncbi:hypothetical protein cyc_02374 [Cyclospora cayetanensis]|uniref:Uncharacterized protein n=1 Tax=Cyclospora cayetanensis TaxID=88456 RepID=A0A1D3D8M4_9EIME|nr:hypothetical protein cyc_02374 [Cyclospora cayetanensis]
MELPTAEEALAPHSTIAAAAGRANVCDRLTAALLQHAGLVGAALLPFRVLGYDARLSLATLKTDAASAPTLILAAANVCEIHVPNAGGSNKHSRSPCFLTLVRASSSLHALLCPRRPNASLLN